MIDASAINTRIQRFDVSKQIMTDKKNIHPEERFMASSKCFYRILLAITKSS